MSISAIGVISVPFLADAIAIQRTLGEVGTTGLSTGNHLHWDLLINGVWVDATVWQEQGMDCWALEALDQPCVP